MQMNDEQIERMIAGILASEAGALYGSSPNAPRNAAGKRVFDAMEASLSADVNAAGEEGQANDAHAR
jgi:hypothetical protein